MTDTLVAMLIPLAGIQIAMLVHAISLIKEIKMAPPVEEQVVASLQDAAKELVGGDIKKRGVTLRPGVATYIEREGLDIGKFKSEKRGV